MVEKIQEEVKQDGKDVVVCENCTKKDGQIKDLQFQAFKRDETMQLILNQVDAFFKQVTSTVPIYNNATQQKAPVEAK